MQIIVLSIHLLVCVALIGLVLLQRSEGGALGMGGGGGSALMSGRGAADALARMTSFAGGFFLVTSLSLTFISGAASPGDGRSIFDSLPRIQQQAPAPATTPTTQPAPEPVRPDPTESSAPETASTQLAAAVVPPAPPVQQQVAPSPIEARTRAVPLEQRTTGTAQTTPTAVRTTPVRQSPPATGGTSGQPQSAPARTTAPPQLQPNAVTGINLTDDPQNAAESSDGGVQAVRRERAGPDQ
ncbi:preprotein translocase subunit SecG [Terricaulis sp.]|uniref:preprotein translocase subunit SecG n=1 Tax=Terricaulis sp. TaxID=2768686 RepID=UPI00378515E2